jgi:hypothetical protein
VILGRLVATYAWAHEGVVKSVIITLGTIAGVGVIICIGYVREEAKFRRRGFRLQRPFRVEERRPVWNALSCLFLDTDTSLLTDDIAKTLVASPYSSGELGEILIEEVYPVCHWNLFSFAGEWAGFDEAWLEQRILARRHSPRLFAHWMNLGRFTVPTSLQWRRVLRAVETRRRGMSSEPQDAT